MMQLVDRQTMAFARPWELLEQLSNLLFLLFWPLVFVVPILEFSLFAMVANFFVNELLFYFLPILPSIASFLYKLLGPFLSTHLYFSSLLLCSYLQVACPSLSLVFFSSISLAFGSLSFAGLSIAFCLAFSSFASSLCSF